MDLFPPASDLNLLPCDGTVHYHGRVLTPAEADGHTAALLAEVPWQHDEAVIFGKRIITARQVAWYGDQRFSYTYSGATRHALPWTPRLLALKALVERHCAVTFNSCLLNLYHNGNEGMAWHSDDEKSLAKNGAIGSLSLGAERRFCLKHKRTGQGTEVLLEHGSLLVMKDATQTHWLHSIPKAKRITTPRINLTFRMMVAQG